MLELFPEGFAEVEWRRGDRSSPRSRTRREPSGCVRGSTTFASRPCPTAGRPSGSASTARSRSARSGSGRPGRRRRPVSLPVVIDPGRAFGTGAHPTTQLCLELHPASRAREPPRHRLRLGRARDRGVQARLRARRRGRRRRGCGRGHEAQRGGERRPRGSARCSTAAERRAARRRGRGREHRLEDGFGAGAAGAVPHARDLGVLRIRPAGRRRVRARRSRS